MYVSAVLPWMSAMAGAVVRRRAHPPVPFARVPERGADPAVRRGAEKAGRSLADVTLEIPIMTAVGDTEAEIAASREHARMMIAFYGSTRTYSPVFEVHGYDGLSDRLNAAQREGDMAAMGAMITDDVLDHYIVSSTWDDLAEALLARYGSIAPNVRVMSYTAMNQMKADPGVVDRWSDVAAAMRAA